MYNRKHVFSLDACSICGFDARHPLPASPCRSNTATSSMNVCCLCVCVCVCGACRNEYYTLFNFHCSVFNVHCCQIHSFERHSYWHRILHYCIAPHALPMCFATISSAFSRNERAIWLCSSRLRHHAAVCRTSFLIDWCLHTHASRRNNHVRVSHCLTFLFYWYGLIRLEIKHVRRTVIASRVNSSDISGSNHFRRFHSKFHRRSITGHIRCSIIDFPGDSMHTQRILFFFFLHLLDTGRWPASK